MNDILPSGSKIKKLYTAMLLLTLTALFVTGILVSLHFKTADTGSFCNLNDYWNCDKVNKSPFAEIFGIPVSFLGFGFYLFFSVLLVMKLKNFNLDRLIKPFNTKHLLWLSSGIGVGGAIWIFALETTWSGPLLPLAILKGLIFVALQLLLLYKYRGKESPDLIQAAFLLSLVLTGVNFSLYLSFIEFFVLEAICVFCITQQILIILIALLNTQVLWLFKNEHK